MEAQQLLPPRMQLTEHPLPRFHHLLHCSSRSGSKQQPLSQKLSQQQAAQWVPALHPGGLTECVVCRAGPQAVQVGDVLDWHDLQVAGGCWAAVVEHDEPVRLHSRGGGGWVGRLRGQAGG